MTLIADRAAVLKGEFQPLDNIWGTVPAHVLARMAALVGDADCLYVDGDLQRAGERAYSNTLLVVVPGRFVVASLRTVPWDRLGPGGEVFVESFPWRAVKVEIQGGGEADDTAWTEPHNWPERGRVTLTFERRPAPLTLPLSNKPTEGQRTRLAALLPLLLATV